MKLPDGTKGKGEEEGKERGEEKKRRQREREREGKEEWPSNGDVEGHSVQPEAAVSGGKRICASV